MEALVSVIIPAFNAERFIGETIDSVIAQSYTSWELIIVNDGSNDSTKEIIENKMQQDKRIHLIDQKNSGVSAARNNGIRNAKGDFLDFLDADDIWLKDNLKEKITLLLNEAKVDFVFSDINTIDERSQIISSSISGDDSNIFKDTLLWNSKLIPNPCGNIVFRKSCLTQNIYFPTELSNIADKYFIVQLSRYFKGKRIAKSLINYREVSGSMSKNIILHETDTIKAYNLYKELDLFKNSAFRRKCFSNMYLIIAGSWWKNGKNKIRGLYFIFRALFTDPINTINKIMSKIF